MVNIAFLYSMAQDGDDNRMTMTATTTTVATFQPDSMCCCCCYAQTAEQRRNLKKSTLHYILIDTLFLFVGWNLEFITRRKHV